MPSHAERQKKYLAKLKGRIERGKLKRQENLHSIREKNREWQKCYREQKKAGKTINTSPAYKTTSTLTRAIRKA